MTRVQITWSADCCFGGSGREEPDTAVEYDAAAVITVDAIVTAPEPFMVAGVTRRSDDGDVREEVCLLRRGLDSVRCGEEWNLCRTLSSGRVGCCCWQSILWTSRAGAQGKIRVAGDE